jgi:hypothetical protein
MPLIRNIEDPRFVKQLDGINHRIQFIRELASVILPEHDEFESVWAIANRVYDRHCSPPAGSMKRSRLEQPPRTALSA